MSGMFGRGFFLTVFLIFLSFVVTDSAACRRTNRAVMTGHMTGYAADDRPLDAAFCIS